LFPQLLEYVGKGKSIVDVGLAQARRPLNTRFHYYELEITDPGEKCYIALGLARRVTVSFITLLITHVFINDTPYHFFPTLCWFSVGKEHFSPPPPPLPTPPHLVIAFPHVHRCSHCFQSDG